MGRKKYYTSGQMEADISDVVTQFEKESAGRGPLEIKSYIMSDMIIIRMYGVLTRSEKKLLKSDHKLRNIELIKNMKTEILESGRPLLETAIKNITRRKVKTLHTDLSTVSDEKVIILILEKPVEFQ